MNLADPYNTGIVVRPDVVLHTKPAGEVVVCEQPAISPVMAFAIGLVVGAFGMAMLSDEDEEDEEAEEAK